MIKYLLAAISLLIVGCKSQSTKPVESIVYVGIGDSITRGEKSSAGNAPGDFAVRELDTTARFMNLGVSGESIVTLAKRHAAIQDSLKKVPTTSRLLVGLAYGANDVMTSPKEEVLAGILRTASWVQDSLGVKEVLIIPIMNRQDQYCLDHTKTFNQDRIWVNAQLHASNLPGVHVANETDSPAMYQEQSPLDKKRFADFVHPLTAGSKELGEGTIAHGIASFPGIRLK